MIYSLRIKDFADWRDKARLLLQNNIEPSAVHWSHAQSAQETLFEEDELVFPLSDKKSEFFIPKKFLPFASTLACYRDHFIWQKLYQLLWRLTHDEKHLLELSSDPLMHDLMLTYQAIRRDAHKMKAFVRFCKFDDEEGCEYFLAWYKPDHRILRLVAPFFQRRFEVMRWTIVTPDETVSWNGEALIYSEGRTITKNPEDALEDLWQTYYRAIFNPARVKIKAMKREMPVRFWHNLPETKMIPELLKDAPHRVARMMRHQEGLASSAADFLPVARHSISQLHEHAKACQGCPLHQQATQTVFGRGCAQARLILVGEQPGDNEDLMGLPFVGPAGQLLDEVLTELNITREQIYITNAVKHFKYSVNGQLRIHRTPSIREINACKPWLINEIALIKPKVILCLGLTAAKSLINPAFRMKQERGQFKQGDDFLIGASYHPSALLRTTSPQIRDELMQNFKQDLKKAFQLSEEQ